MTRINSSFLKSQNVLVLQLRKRSQFEQVHFGRKTQEQRNVYTCSSMKKRFPFSVYSLMLKILTTLEQPQKFCIHNLLL